MLVHPLIIKSGLKIKGRIDSMDSAKKEVAKLYDELVNLRLNLKSPLVSDLLKEKLKPKEESLKMKIIEA